ncbi:MAG TPA: hypothetical protein VMQ10_10420, partial [Spirochaetia bacterium]|nr:hypothetical protein [Spirochaetia bacterium]
MDRRTLLAVVVSVVIIVAGMILTPIISPPKKIPTPAPTAQAPTQPQTPAPTQPQAQPQGTPAAGTAAATAPAARPGSVAPVPGQAVVLPDSAPPASQPATITRETDLYTLTFNADGGTLSSVKLKKFSNLDGSPVEMLLTPPGGTPNESPFALSFGDYTAGQLTVPFTLKESSDGDLSTFDFSRT